MPDEAGNSLLQAGNIKVGFVTCRIREKANVPQCYGCLEFGHLASIVREWTEKQRFGNVEN